MHYRIGMIVPSSNTTMETEIPAMLQGRTELYPNETFTFHSSRMRMQQVTKEELARMDQESDRCAMELSDARCDVIAYACLIAIMSQGRGYHCISEKRLQEVTKENGFLIPVTSSAGALVEGLKSLRAKKVSIITPYMKALTNMVVDYFEDVGVEVVDSISLEISDNVQVGRLNPMDLVEKVNDLQVKGADAVVLSACVQMPSLPAIQKVEDRLGIPVVSAATATVYQILKHLELETVVPNAGFLLSNKHE